MKKPVIMAVDDDEDVLDALGRDLKDHYSKSYKIVTVTSGDKALEVSQKLKQRNDIVALFLSDQRMPGMQGVDFLAKARLIYPDAKFALLTAYADTDAAIKAINEVKIDFYLTKPWDPPEEKLLPVLDDLLSDWLAKFRPPFEGIKVVGHRWSPSSHSIKEFLAKNLVPYKWIDVERNGESQSYINSLEKDKVKFPLLVLPDGVILENPKTDEIAGKIGLQTQAADPFYDLVIIGGGPAGLASAVYASSEGLKTVLIEKEAPGGQAGTSTFIENYLGFPSGLTGADLTRRAVAQAKKFGTELISPTEVKELSVNGDYKKIVLENGSILRAYSVIVATGASYRKLEAEGVNKLTGKGVYYGASISEAQICRSEDIFIVGGGNSAGQSALYLSKFARSVTLLIRKEDLKESMSEYLVEQIHEMENISIRNLCRISKVEGEEKLEYIEITHCETAETELLKAHALFIYIGANPCTSWLEGCVELDEHGFIVTGRDIDKKIWKKAEAEREPYFLETTLPGVFAAGDVRSGSVKRVASAVGEGAMVVSFIHRYIGKFR